jgi:hypothetical protein
MDTIQPDKLYLLQTVSEELAIYLSYINGPENQEDMCTVEVKLP